MSSILASLESILPKKKPHIRLVMIVKDEAAVIERCLCSVRHFIDSFLIVDTGSTDDTPERIVKVMELIPGQIHFRPWVDFSTNRNQAFELAEEMGGADYFFVIDADEMAMGSPVAEGICKSARVLYMDKNFPRVCLLNAKTKWRYEGKVHEQLTPKNMVALAGNMHSLYIRSFGDGGRHRVPGWQERDIVAALDDFTATQDPRIAFHIGQMYENCGRLGEAIEIFETRIKMGGWDEEVWYSMFRIAEIKRRQSTEFSEEVINAYLRPLKYRPKRTEPGFRMASYLEEHGKGDVAAGIRNSMKGVPLPNDRLHVDRSCYAA